MPFVFTYITNNAVLQSHHSSKIYPSPRYGIISLLLGHQSWKGEFNPGYKRDTPCPSPYRSRDIPSSPSSYFPSLHVEVLDWTYSHFLSFLLDQLSLPESYFCSALCVWRRSRDLGVCSPTPPCHSILLWNASTSQKPPTTKESVFCIQVLLEKSRTALILLQTYLRHASSLNLMTDDDDGVASTPSSVMGSWKITFKPTTQQCQHEEMFTQSRQPFCFE